MTPLEAELVAVLDMVGAILPAEERAALLDNSPALARELARYGQARGARTVKDLYTLGVAERHQPPQRP